MIVEDSSWPDLLFMFSSLTLLQMFLRGVIVPRYVAEAQKQEQEPVDPFYQQAYDEALAELDELYGVTDVYNPHHT